MKPAVRVSLFMLLLGRLPATAGFAGVLLPPFVHETPTTTPGLIEFEKSVTWETHTPNNPQFNEVDFRLELEFGITNSFRAPVYFADWNYRNSPLRLRWVSKPLA
jgi:hypothetical protein